MPRLDCRLGTEAENDATRVGGAFVVVVAAAVVDSAEVAAARRGTEPPVARRSRCVVLDSFIGVAEQSRIDNAGILKV